MLTPISCPLAGACRDFAPPWGRTAAGRRLASSGRSGAAARPTAPWTRHRRAARAHGRVAARPPAGGRGALQRIVAPPERTAIGYIQNYYIQVLYLSQRFDRVTGTGHWPLLRRGWSSPTGLSAPADPKPITMRALGEGPMTDLDLADAVAAGDAAARTARIPRRGPRRSSASPPPWRHSSPAVDRTRARATHRAWTCWSSRTTTRSPGDSPHRASRGHRRMVPAQSRQTLTTTATGGLDRAPQTEGGEPGGRSATARASAGLERCR